MRNIKFSEQPKLYKDSCAFIAHLSEIKTEDELFNQLNEKLKFPDYFGYNWNAVYDCIRDFNWITEKGIILIHDEMPMIDEMSLEIYLKILFEAVQDWKDGEEHYFEIIFPKQSEELIKKYIERLCSPEAE